LITLKENVQLKELIEYRNIINHGIHKLTNDILAYSNISDLHLSDGIKIEKSITPHFQNSRTFEVKLKRD